MSTGGGAGEEEDVLGSLTTKTSTILSLSFLSQWVAGGGGDGFPEKESQLPRKKLAATQLENMRICQD